MLSGNIIICFTRFFLLFVPLFTQAQTDTVVAKSYQSHNPNDMYSIFMENENLPLRRKEELTYSITITVTGIRNKAGVIRFKFYDDTSPFPHDKGFLRIVVPKFQVTEHNLTITYYGFTARKMGIALLDDENNNWKLDTGWFFPKEGHAFSDYYHSSFRRPVYSDFSFFLSGDKHVIMKMKYY